MFHPLDGPALQAVLTVTNTTPIRAIGSGSPFPEGKVITMQSHEIDDPNYGAFYVYFASQNENPTAQDLQDKAFVQNRNSLHTYEASDSQAIWVMSVTEASIQIRMAERA